MNKYELPKASPLRNRAFVFGVATSSYQIEGGVAEGGGLLRYGIHFVEDRAKSIKAIMVTLRVIITTVGSKILK